MRSRNNSIAWRCDKMATSETYLVKFLQSRREFVEHVRDSQDNNPTSEAFINGYLLAINQFEEVVNIYHARRNKEMMDQIKIIAYGSIDKGVQ